MTIARRDGRDTPFSQWVRDHPELDSRECKLSITDPDLWVHRYGVRQDRLKKQATDVRDVVDSIMLVEVKTFSKGLDFAQADTLNVINGLLRQNIVNGKRRAVFIEDTRYGARGKRQVRCFGVHLLQLSGDRPDNSAESIYWDRSLIGESVLIELLRFERDPDAPSRHLDTRRHHILKARPTLQLFDVA